MPIRLKKWCAGTGPKAAEKGYTDSSKEVFTITDPSEAEHGHADSDESVSCRLRPMATERRHADRVEEEACRHWPDCGRAGGMPTVTKMEREAVCPI